MWIRHQDEGPQITIWDNSVLQTNIYSTTDSTDDVAHSARASYYNNDIKIYLDEVQAATDGTATITDEIDMLYIGAGYNGNTQGNPMIRNVRVLKKATRRNR